MIQGLSALTALSETFLFQLFIVFIRVGAIVSLLPVFGEQMIPNRIKLGLAIAFTAIVFPAVPDLSQTRSMLGSLGLFFAEGLTGLFFGIMLRLFVIVLHIAGSIAAQSTSLSQLFGGNSVEPLPAMGHVLVIGGLALMTVLGMHVQFAAFMIHSYTLVPVGEVIPADVLNKAGVAEISKAFALGFTLAAPFVIASFVYNVTLGIINKAMPQLMVAFVGAPAITAGGLAILMLAAPIMLSIWSSSFENFLMDPFRSQR